VTSCGRFEDQGKARGTVPVSTPLGPDQVNVLLLPFLYDQERLIRRFRKGRYSFELVNQDGLQARNRIKVTSSRTYH
jgi:hypothetical protein